MKYEYDLAVIGGGSAGLLAAKVAPNLGVKTLLIERSRLGGDCLWTGCVPSKALLASAKVAHTLRHADRFGLPASDAPADTAAVWRRLRGIQDEIAATDDNPEAVRAGGADVILGEASLIDGHTVRTEHRTISARYILICTGSRPATPPVEGLAETGALTSETIFTLERAPASLLIVGGGPIGVEMAQAMNRLGVRVTLLEAMERLLPRDEPSLADTLTNILRDEGVDVHLSAHLHHAERGAGKKMVRGEAGGAQRCWTADEIFIAAGRTPNVESLELDRAGVTSGPRGIIVDDHLRTSVSSVYAVGDCAGRFLFTHSAGAETSVALRNMFYPGAQKAPGVVPWTTFTDPELAHVGMTSEEARRAHGDDGAAIHEWDLTSSDRARAEGAPPGRILVVTKRSQEIVGAHILAPSAGEMIGQFTLAIAQQIPLIPAFRDLIEVYPTYSTSIPQTTEAAVYARLRQPFYRAARRIGDLLGT